MRIMCAWCETFLGTKEPLEDHSETHGMCDICYKQIFDEVDHDSSGNISEGLPSLRGGHGVGKCGGGKACADCHCRKVR